MRRIVVVLAVGSLAACAWALLREPPRDAAPAPSRARAEAAAKRSPAREPTPSAMREPAAKAPTQTAGAESRFATAVLEPDPREDPDTVRWDDVAPSDRREILERNLRSSIRDARNGRATGASVARAEATLSVLRAELMNDEAGAARYAQLEAEVESLSAGSSTEPSSPRTQEVQR